jgi:hypothetical protein
MSINAVLASRPTKAQYSEAEAATALEVSVEELRTLIRNHIMSDENDLNNLAVTSFQPSDLLVLRILALQAKAITPH